MGKLTTHVLDTSHGRPGAGMRVRLFDADGVLLVDTRTNDDGRCDAPLLQGAALKAGSYRLEFSVGDYFRALIPSLPEPAFLDVVPIAFGVADPEGHYHVPLLVSPFGFSSYRGS